ncbi:MAG TPA: hypothetical protein VHL59_05670, partial [Thermoanaerobaculia bacterium]|nr:hypothetical protein [Thermoanaerobaculia bacterium]
SYGTFRFPLGTWGQSYYAGLAEGFLGGRLGMAHPPPPELARLANPYDMNARGDLPVLWDASYFEGKYYLYFSPVPVVLFYVPVRLIASAYPSDELAATFFASLSFLILAALLRRARPKQLPLWLWILLLGVGNVIPYVLVASMFYQVAIACAMAFTAAWAYSLLRFFETTSTRWAIAMGAFLGLAIATRPNLAVLLLVQLIVLFRHRRAIVPVLAPLVAIACALAVYNYARFRSPTEFGVSYQIARVPMKAQDLCGVCGAGEAMRLANHATHYVFWAPLFYGRFPYIAVQKHRLDPEVSYPGGPEPVAGFAPITPLLLVGTAFAVLLGFRARGTYLVVAGWLVLLGLAACWWITARYTLDFLGLLLAGSILCVEEGLSFLGVRRLRWICALLAIYSIAVGLLLPFSRGAEFLR